MAKFLIAGTDEKTNATLYGKLVHGKLHFAKTVVPDGKRVDMGLHMQPSDGTVMDIADAGAHLVNMHEREKAGEHFWLRNRRIVVAPWSVG